MMVYTNNFTESMKKTYGIDIPPNLLYHYFPFIQNNQSIFQQFYRSESWNNEMKRINRRVMLDLYENFFNKDGDLSQLLSIIYALYTIMISDKKNFILIVKDLAIIQNCQFGNITSQMYTLRKEIIYGPYMYHIKENLLMLGEFHHISENNLC